jgi:hypothetical protein
MWQSLFFFGLFDLILFFWLLFKVENSRPNSIYNLSGPPTDIEASRPQSALTSYSNFHGQRTRPTGSGNAAAANGRPNVTNLTQESLLSVSFLRSLNVHEGMIKCSDPNGSAIRIHLDYLDPEYRPEFRIQASKFEPRGFT